MQITTNPVDMSDKIAQLFKYTFTASEGADEGAAVHDLAHELLTTTPEKDIRVFIARDDGSLHGCAIFTRLLFPDDTRTAFLLSPMAVATDQQRKGVGRALLQAALNSLRAEGVDVAVTYGDPAFYGQVGFQQVTTETVPAPQPLSMPEGWIAQSLTDAPLTPLPGPSFCVSALNRPDIW